MFVCLFVCLQQSEIGLYASVVMPRHLSLYPSDPINTRRKKLAKSSLTDGMKEHEFDSSFEVKKENL